jgi:hypothetical protein
MRPIIEVSNEMPEQKQLPGAILIHIAQQLNIPVKSVLATLKSFK